MANVEKIDGGGNWLIPKSFGELSKKDAERFDKMTEQIKDLAEMFLGALQEPIEKQKNCFREILEAARDQEISDTIIRIALSIALEKKYPCQTDLRMKTRNDIENLLSS
ncbi:MAG: hypothetical protein ABIE14_02740 [Patescibacteria group bacterium]